MYLGVYVCDSVTGVVLPVDSFGVSAGEVEDVVVVIL